MKWEGLSVLVTGSSGFIGSHLCDKLRKLKANIIQYDLKDGNDVLDQALLETALKRFKVKVVFHLAARLEILNMVSPLHDFLTNAGGTLSALEASRKSGVKKFIYASSSGIYGEPLHLPIHEEHQKKPFWHYGVSKHAGEQYVYVYNQLYGLDTASLRYGIVYGTREWYGRALTRFIKRVLNDEPPIVFAGASEQTRDYVHVSDVVEATILAAEKEKKHTAYNIGSGIPVSIMELAELVIRKSGKDLIPIVQKVEKGQLGRKHKELQQLFLDCARAKEELGWEPKVKFEDGVLEELVWAKDNVLHLGGVNHYWTKDRV